jgi:translocation and assembly module TamA
MSTERAPRAGPVRCLAARLQRALHAAALSLLLALPVQSAHGEPLTVTITGLAGEPLDNVRASLGIERHRGEEQLDEERIRELHDAAERDIRRALEPFGYYRPEIDAALDPPAQPDGPWRASYTIDPGPQVPVQAVEVRFAGPGAEDAALAALSDDFPLRRDSQLDHRHYEAAKRNLLEAVRRLGYLDATYLEHRVAVDLASYSASISLAIGTGPRYRFGPITFDQDQFDPEYLEKYLILQPGEPFKHSLVSRQRAVLGKSGHFQEVLTELGDPILGEHPAIPVTIRLVPYPANRYRGQLSWGTDTDFGVQVDWTRRYLGRRGHSFNLGAGAVQDRDRLAGDFSYMIPLNPVRGQWIELAARHESKDLTYDDVDLDEGGDTRIATNLASVFLHRPDTRLGGFELQATAGVSLVGETYDVFEVLFGNLPGEAQQNIKDRIGKEAFDTLAPDFEAVVPSVTLILKDSDNPLFIRRGDYYRLDLLGAEESLGSNISFWQARLNTWNIFPLGDGGRLLLRTAAGYSDADSRVVLGVNFNQMPEYYEFRVGGARSVRGYGFEELYSADTITGGKHKLVGSVEYEHEIIPDWSAAVFLDAGNAFNDFDDVDPKYGAGIGLRWRSPVGLARVDLGIPIDDAEDSFQIYITVGPEF